MLVVGVNGVGKTTMIGKLAAREKAQGTLDAPGRGRHVPRGGGGPARGVGGARGRGPRAHEGGRRPGGGRVRRRERGGLARDRHRDRRHGGAPAQQEQPHGGAGEDPARDRRARCRARRTRRCSRSTRRWGRTRCSRRGSSRRRSGSMRSSSTSSTAPPGAAPSSRSCPTSSCRSRSWASARGSPTGATSTRARSAARWCPLLLELRHRDLGLLRPPPGEQRSSSRPCPSPTTVTLRFSEEYGTSGAVVETCAHRVGLDQPVLGLVLAHQARDRHLPRHPRLAHDVRDLVDRRVAGVARVPELALEPHELGVDRALGRGDLLDAERVDLALVAARGRAARSTCRPAAPRSSRAGPARPCRASSGACRPRSARPPAGP